MQTYSFATQCARTGTEKMHASAREASCTQRRERLRKSPIAQGSIAWHACISRGSVPRRTFLKRRRRALGAWWKCPTTATDTCSRRSLHQGGPDRHDVSEHEMLSWEGLDLLVPATERLWRAPALPPLAVAQGAQVVQCSKR